MFLFFLRRLIAASPARRRAWLWAAAAGIACWLNALPIAVAQPSPGCGGPGLPACPMQRWMRHELATALAHKDLKGLARGLERLEAMNPDPSKWHNWTKFARDGAKAARDGRASGVIASCGRCHSIYRREFNMRFRRRKVDAPEGR